MHTFHGSLVALITPFKEGKLDECPCHRHCVPSCQ